MEKHLDMIKKINELSQTGLEGLEHIHSKAKEGKFETTIYLFQDVFNSFREIDQTMQEALPPGNNTSIQQITASLLKGFQTLLAAYNKEENMRPLEILQFTLLPYYRKWQEEIQKHLEPCVIS